MKRIYLNIKYFLKNLHFVYIKTDNVAHSFAGYGRHWLARKYADKRTEATSADGVTGRKRHYCFPYANDIIMVCNRTELIKMRDKKIVNKKANLPYMLENATYISK